MADNEPLGEILLYQTPDGRSRVECRFVDETLWLSQALMAEVPGLRATISLLPTDVEAQSVQHPQS